MHYLRASLEKATDIILVDFASSENLSAVHIEDAFHWLNQKLKGSTVRSFGAG
jgi:hypothetical protein